MKDLLKIIASLVLIIIFLLACFTILTAGYAGLWLHTYTVFTDKIKVADVQISELKTDDSGKYVDVKFTELKYQSGLEKLFNINSGGQTESSYKIYGDTVYIGGPVIKFKDELILLNFKSIYKLAKVYGRYSENTLEVSRTNDALTNYSYDINEGYQNWKSLFDIYQGEGALTNLANSVIDNMQLSEPGQFASNKVLNYELYIGNNGFVWELVR